MKRNRTRTINILLMMMMVFGILSVVFVYHSYMSREECM